MRGKVRWQSFGNVGSAVGEIEMIAKPEHDPHQNDTYRGKRRRQEKALDEALKNTFPASDPVSVEQPLLSAAAERKRFREVEKARGRRTSGGIYIVRRTKISPL